ncbi:MAG: hypothetical protein ABFD92_16870 [Planctomycetaceae bacterium]|nr:hypothetical protein [Planctomycetaceae bacterium]
MGYDLTGLTVVECRRYDQGRLLRVASAHGDGSAVQLYVSGRLAAWQHPVAGVVEFVLSDSGEADVFFLLAVDADSAATDYWEQAFPEAAAHGNRIRVRVPLYFTYAPGDVLEIYRGAAGEALADILEYRTEIFPGGRGACGRGMGRRGYGGRGWHVDSAAGRGMGGRGYGPRGFYASLLTWRSEPLPPGTYKIAVQVTDAAGNVSTQFSGLVVLDTYARPASGLTVESYDKATDTLSLSWTHSPDVY